MSAPITDSSIVDRYIELGLRMGRHIDGFVDAYYGPEVIADRISAEQVSTPEFLVASAGQLVVDLDAGVDDGVLDASRRRWLRAQATGMHTSARKMAGEEIAYVDEVEWCYGVRPTFREEDQFEGAHVRLDAVLPGSGPVRERIIEWREAQAIPVDRLDAVLSSIAEDFRERTQRQFGLPEGEHIAWELASNQPWSGFNYYEGNLQSRVAINTDLPVLATSIGHLVAHEAYPGHHTEHSRKESGLVRSRGWQEESIFCVGTPQCLIAEGLADLALEIIAGEVPDLLVAEHLRSNGIDFDPEIAHAVRIASESMDAVRANAAWLLHEDGVPVDDVVAYIERWALLPHARASKAIEFLTSPTWRSYISCYVEGLPLCRNWVAGDPDRFAILLSEQIVPADLVEA
ncbi:MAG: DUF885 domain-containing protein [Actinobacteria bacterium]|nr:DUF885 domain-containing protein [Actinomycetota bacterium]